MKATEKRREADIGGIGLRWLPGRFAFCRCPAAADIPAWALAATGLVSITRTEDELSIIVPEEAVPRGVDGIKVEAGFAAMCVVPPTGHTSLDFGLVGILAALTGALADSQIPVCAVSTFDTDILFIKAEHVSRAEDALKKVARVE